MTPLHGMPSSTTSCWTSRKDIRNSGHHSLPVSSLGYMPFHTLKVSSFANEAVHNEAIPDAVCARHFPFLTANRRFIVVLIRVALATVPNPCG